MEHITGSPAATHGTTERYVCDTQCVQCKREQSARRRQKEEYQSTFCEYQRKRRKDPQVAQRNRDAANRYYNKHRENPETIQRRRELRIARLYDMTEEKFQQLREVQNDKCAICLIEFGDGRPHIDHDHTTGRVRGLLCSPCNTMLGQAHDNVTVLLNAVKYLESQCTKIV